MKKSTPILAVCVSGGLLCSATNVVLSQVTTPPESSSKQTQNFEDVPVSKAAQAGDISKSLTTVSVVASRSMNPKQNNIESDSAAKSSDNADSKSETTVHAIVEIRDTKVPDEDVQWTVEVTQIASRGDTSTPPTPLARTTNRNSDSKPTAINEEIFVQQRATDH
ncbi:hypothetical protein KOR42_08730 [Thalassoglobus neptunius]|uniref:Uncharacterized protein n=1 Tax=Thalassoglobus neptunius TaxID=1938619 RepID=A0A5C5X677_9PLAN|nr:hypothetical protein [Thalassoglobus neptunius]TWT57512.1 hypothetical protein KOR42_08730 [Thalassoglobus neptunius]